MYSSLPGSSAFRSMAIHGLRRRKVTLGGFARVLVAVDGRDDAATVVEAAVGLASVLHAELRVLHVIDPRAAVEPNSGVAPDELLTELRASGESILSRAGRLTEQQNVPHHGVMREGKPAQKIIEDAREWSADVLVIGGHSQSRIERALSPSTTDRVVGDPPCPVLVVPTFLG